MATVDVQALKALQASLNASIDKYVAAAESNASPKGAQEEAQEHIHHTANALSHLCANPFMELLKIGFQPTVNVGIRIAIDLELFDHIKEKATLAELVQKTGAEEILLFRVMRLLVSIQMFQEPELHSYASTPLSKAFGNKPLRDMIKTCFDTLSPIWQECPAWVRSNNFKDIQDLENNPCRDLYNANFFDALSKFPEREADFASAMTSQDNAAAEVIPLFPYADAAPSVQTELSTDPNTAFIVDVGGGRGQYLNSVLKSNPDLPGRKIVQDLPSVVAKALTDNGIEAMPHDFFTPQPIKHAKFYHMRGIMHDWPDDTCNSILDQLHPAFKPGYSRLLIHTYVLPIKNVSKMEAMLDLNMWVHCGMERDEAQWEVLLGKSGFKILRIVRAHKGPFGIIEADLTSDANVTNGAH